MLTGTAVYGTVCTVVWEDGGGKPASYGQAEFIMQLLTGPAQAGGAGGQ